MTSVTDGNVSTLLGILRTKARLLITPLSVLIILIVALVFAKARSSVDFAGWQIIKRITDIFVPEFTC